MSVATASEELLLGGFNARTPWKATCRVCATTNLTLAGEQTVDGVAAEDGDRVLATGQTAPKENGIYVVSTGAWTRAKDYRAENSAQLGTTVLVAAGTSNSGVWRMTSPTSGTVTPGVTSTTWTKVGAFGSAAASSVMATLEVQDYAEVGTTVGNAAATGLLRFPASGPHIVVRNEADTADIDVLSKTALDRLDIGDASTSLNLIGTSVLVNGAAIGGGAYTAGDGLTLTGSDFDIDMTDTAIFTQVGTASRVPRLNGSSQLNCLGVVTSSASAAVLYTSNATSLTVGHSGMTSCTIDGGTTCTVTAATVNVATTAADVLNAGNSTGATTIAGSTCAVNYNSSCVIQGTRPSTDVRPPPTHIVVGQATSLASGSTTAANKVGPHLAITLGRGQTTGTDAPGGMFIGLGDAVSSTISNGITIGYGAPTGTPGDDAYRPYTTLLARHSYTSGEYKLDVPSVGLRAYGGTNAIMEGGSGVYLVAAGGTKFQGTSTGIGFYGATPAAKPTVSGSRGGNAALASLLTALATLGLITDSSTA